MSDTFNLQFPFRVYLNTGTRTDAIYGGAFPTLDGALNRVAELRAADPFVFAWQVGQVVQGEEQMEVVHEGHVGQGPAAGRH